MERSIAERNVDTKLSKAEFTCAPSAELSEAEFLAHVILKGVAFNTSFSYSFIENIKPIEAGQSAEDFVLRGFARRFRENLLPSGRDCA